MSSQDVYASNIQKLYELINFIPNDQVASFVFNSDVLITNFQQIEVLGHSLYTYGAVLLIILSVILLLAMFATIIISKSNKNI
jgi:NADH-ubiquinone oxidoreductase chain 6